MQFFKQKFVKNLILPLIIFLIAIIHFFVVAEKTKAAAICNYATIHVIARNENGTVIPGISYQILEERENSDGMIRPGNAVSSGKIDNIFGEGVSKFSPTKESYIIKMFDKNPAYGAFYFYNELTAACGEEKTFTAYLSGLQIELRDTNGVLRKNTSFTISQQGYDANGEPIKQKGATVATLNSDAAGQNIIYLADSSHTIDQSTVYYVFSSPAYGDSEYVLYYISPDDGKTKEINYIFSDIKISFKDKNKNKLPVGTNVEFLTQKYDTSGRTVVDKLIKTLSVDSSGYIFFEYPAGTYYFRIKKPSGGYYNFPNISILDRTSTSLTLDVVDNSTGQAFCAANSIINVTARNSSGSYIPGIKFVLFEKALNANNQPAGGAQAAQGTTNNLGAGSASFKSDSGKTYILKIYDKNANNGAFWYYDGIKFTCGENKNITKNLSSISLTARDLNGNLLKDVNFSLYLQKKDIDNNLLKIKDFLVADMKTNFNGQATIYVTGGDPAQYQDIARYLISLKYGDGMVFDRPDINITAEADTQVNFTISGLSLTVVDAGNNRLSKGTKINIYEQKIDAYKNKILGKNISSFLLDDYGKGLVALPAGTYALGIKDNGGKTMNFWDYKVENGLLSSKVVNVSSYKITAPAVSPAPLLPASSLANRLKGYVLLQVESKGEAWYVNPQNKKRYYLRNGAASFDYMRSLGLGVKNSDLNKIPVGVLSTSGEADCDNDGLADSLEQAIGTQACNGDSDSDGYADNIEVLHNYDPLGPGKSVIDEKLVARLSGGILLQVESNGEVWYVNPKDKKRYYLKDGEAALKIMKYLSLGIKNSDLNIIDRAD